MNNPPTSARAFLCAAILTGLLGCRTQVAVPPEGGVTPVKAQLPTLPSKDSGADKVPASGKIWTELAGGPQPFDFPLRADTIRKLVARANPAVVNIYTTQTTIGRTISDPLGILQFGIPLPRIGTSLGSGFIINKNGYILTADHVVEDSHKIKVVLMPPEVPREARAEPNTDVLRSARGDSDKAGAPAKGEEYDAEVVGRDKGAGVALLKIQPSHALPVLPLGDSSRLQIGDPVIAVGNPYGLSHTVTSGIVSFIGRKLPGESNHDKAKFIQIDAPINPGNSGGPLLDLYGEVVGINTAVAAQAQGIGFAVPVNAAKDALPRLLKGR